MISRIWDSNYNYWLEKNIMKYTTKTLSAFTLVELIVSIMIFGIMMISVMSIFLFSSQMSARVEINRVMQENIKNVVEDIAENVRRNGITWVRSFAMTCQSPDLLWWVISADGLCVWTSEYTIGYFDEIMNLWTRVGSVSTDCSDVNSACHIIKKDISWDYYPLSNSFIHFENIHFIITNTKIPRLSIILTARPSYTKWLAPDIVKNNIMHIQTTLSERLIETN